jgi:hypothetical protein
MRPTPHRVAIPHLLQGKQRPNSSKILKVIQWSNQKFGPFEPVRWSGPRRPPPHRVAIPHLLRKTASGNSSKNLREIQRSDQKLMPFRTGTLVRGDETSTSPSSDSTSIPLKTASRNSCKKWMTIQRSDQKLWPFQTGILVRHDEPSASPSSDSTFTSRKTASEDPTVGLKVMALSNWYAGLERGDLRRTE